MCESPGLLVTGPAPTSDDTLLLSGQHGTALLAWLRSGPPQVPKLLQSAKGVHSPMSQHLHDRPL